MGTNQMSGEVASSGLALPPSSAIPNEVRAAAERLGVGPYFNDVIAFTIEIFGSLENAAVDPDPEVSDWEHISFEVPVTGSVDEILDKDMRWSQRLLATIPRSPRVYTILMNYYE